MSSITIIGTGNMARTIGQLATAGGNTVESLGLRPLDVGGLDTARWLEGASLVEMGLARNGVGHYDFALGVSPRAAARRTHAVPPASARAGAQELSGGTSAL